jgi:hypothetical protein
MKMEAICSSGIISQKMVLFITTAVRTSTPFMDFSHIHYSTPEDNWNSMYTSYSYCGLLVTTPVVWWVGANISGQHTAFIFRVEGFYTKDEGSMFLQNVGPIMHNVTAQKKTI